MLELLGRAGRGADGSWSHGGRVHGDAGRFPDLLQLGTVLGPVSHLGIADEAERRALVRLGLVIGAGGAGARVLVSPVEATSGNVGAASAASATSSTSSATTSATHGRHFAFIFHIVAVRVVGVVLVLDVVCGRCELCGPAGGSGVRLLILFCDALECLYVEVRLVHLFLNGRAHVLSVCRARDVPGHGQVRMSLQRLVTCPQGNLAGGLQNGGLDLVPHGRIDGWVVDDVVDEWAELSGECCVGVGRSFKVVLDNCVHCGTSKTDPFEVFTCWLAVLHVQVGDVLRRVGVVCDFEEFLLEGGNEDIVVCLRLLLVKVDAIAWIEHCLSPPSLSVSSKLVHYLGNADLVVGNVEGVHMRPQSVQKVFWGGVPFWIVVELVVAEEEGQGGELLGVRGGVGHDDELLVGGVSNA